MPGALNHRDLCNLSPWQQWVFPAASAERCEAAFSPARSAVEGVQGAASFLGSCSPAQLYESLAQVWLILISSGCLIIT